MANDFQTIADRLLTPTPEQIERERVRVAERMKADADREQVCRRRNFAEFIGNRKRYAAATLDSWVFPDGDSKAAERQRVVVSAVREFIAAIDEQRQIGSGAIFYGPPGTGKDHLATAIIRAACLEHGHTAEFVNGSAWFVALRDSMDGTNSESDLVRKLTRPDWLVLSDPLPPMLDAKNSTGALTPYQASMLYRVVDERNGRRLPTITTVNVNGGTEGVQRMGAPTWDRLKDGAWSFACAWPSFRASSRIV